MIQKLLLERLFKDNQRHYRPLSKNEQSSRDECINLKTIKIHKVPFYIQASIILLKIFCLFKRAKFFGIRIMSPIQALPSSSSTSTSTSSLSTSSLLSSSASLLTSFKEVLDRFLLIYAKTILTTFNKKKLTTLLRPKNCQP